MRDLRIRAQNFLSHEDTEIKLDGIDAVIVTGKNGSGKSTLLVDAPLVALFGKGRAESIGDYIRNGKDMMTVEYDFSILNDQRYRVIRKHSRKTARGSSSLQFKKIDAIGNEIENLTADSIDETQEVIERTIGTNLETLMHTSIYEQEEGNFFCEARPSERMKLFSKVWDLERYAGYGQIARDMWLGKKDKPGLQTEITAIEVRIGAAKQRILEINVQKESLSAVKKNLDRETASMASLEKKRDELQKNLGAFENLTHDLEKTEQNKIQADQEIEKLSNQHGVLLAKIERFSKILKNREVVIAKVTEEKEKEICIGETETSLKAINESIDTLRVEVDQIHKEHQKLLDIAEESKAKVEIEIKAIGLQEVSLNRELSEVGRKEEQLKHLCVDAEKLKSISCHPDFDSTYVNDTCRFIKDAVEAKRLIPALESEITKKKSEIEANMAGTAAQMREFEEKRAACLRSITEIKEVSSKATLAKETVIKDRTSERNQKLSEIDQLKADLTEIKRYTKLVPEIDLAEKELPGLKTESIDIEKRYSDQVIQKTYLEQEIGKIKEKFGKKKELESELQSVCRQVTEMTVTKDKLTKQLGFIEAEIVQGEILKGQVEKDEKQIEQLESDKAIYQVLEDAFKQIPYMLVSRGVDTIERIANEILGMISSTDLTVQIRTEKETKTTKTLKDEIHLSFQDNEGHKEYKLLSQGEKVRAAIALRLAVSEAQAHRRGVRIDKLIADDVFGALDTEGIEDMKIAMKELKKRFKFTAILTHIEGAQDIFPTRMIFSKGPEGSRVEIQQEYA